jgi:carbonic anhydrase
MLLNGTLWAGNKSFSMVNAHFHTPSEHRIDLAHHEAEMHMVFQNPDGA